MKDEAIKLSNLSPIKFGKSAYCQLSFTESKLADHVLFKDLFLLKTISEIKFNNFELQALNSLAKDRFMAHSQQNYQIKKGLQQKINMYKRTIEYLSQKNIKRVRRMTQNHNYQINKILNQKQEEVKFLQSQKELLEKYISELQSKIQNDKKQSENVLEQIQSIQSQREKMKTQLQKQIQKRMKQQEEFQQFKKQCVEKLEMANQQKLQIQLYYKRILQEKQAQYEQTINQIQKNQRKVLDNKQQARLRQNLKNKEDLNKTMKIHDQQFAQLKQKLWDVQNNLRNNSFQLQSQRKKTTSLQRTLKEQQNIRGQFEQLTKQLQFQISNLKDLLIQSRNELQQAKRSMQKMSIQNNSLKNRMKTCEEEAKMWRQSYYLNKSRIDLN